MNEAAILTARRCKEVIGLSEIDDAVDRIIAGMEGRPLTDGRSKRLIAYHEVGHALIGTLVKDHDPVQKVTLIPRGQAQGLTWFSRTRSNPGHLPSSLLGEPLVVAPQRTCWTQEVTTEPAATSSRWLRWPATW